MDGLVVVANRLPVEFAADGQPVVSPGGLVSALSSVVSPGTQWIGWGGERAGERGTCVVDDLVLHPVHLTDDDLDGFYRGFSNSLLWPLFHGRVRHVELRRAWWHAYQSVNDRFAEEVVRTAPPGGTVWVHDYHLLLTPALIRARRPDLRIGLFLHIPFPAAQLVATLPWRSEILEGMLAADLIGFQSADDAHNFAASTSRLVRNPRRCRIPMQRARQAVIDSFPISVDVTRWNALGEAAGPTSQRVRERIGARTLLFGVDRLDYTKGITQRLRAFRELLDEGLLDPDTTCLVQVAVPTRGDVPGYDEEKDEVESLVAGINDAHRSSHGYDPVLLLDEQCDELQLAAWYRAADALLVTPLADGMNLVAKEFVSARVDTDGVLILSEFAGAAFELDGALLVNPYNLDAMKAAILTAVAMPALERSRRMAAMRAAVAVNDVHHWAQCFLERLQIAGQPVEAVRR